MKAVYWLLPRWFRGRKKGSLRAIRFLVIVGILLGVGAWLTAQAVVAGFSREYTKALLEFNADFVAMGEDEEWFHWSKTDLPKEVIGKTPFLYREALIINQGNIKGVVLKGIDPSTYGEVHKITGERVQTLSGRSVLVGKDLALKLEIRTFPKLIKLMLPKGGSSQRGGAIGELNVVGTFETGLYEYDSQFILLSLNYLNTLFGEKKMGGWEFKVVDPLEVEKVVWELEGKLPVSGEVTTWKELNQDIFEALQLEKNMFQLLLGLMVGVALLNMIAAILLHLFRRRQEIAILRALGLPFSKIRFLFTLEGILLGTFGSLLGILLAWGITGILETTQWISIDPEIYFIDHLPFHFSLELGFLILAVVMLLSLLVSFWVTRGIQALSIREGLHGPA